MIEAIGLAKQDEVFRVHRAGHDLRVEQPEEGEDHDKFEE